MLAAIGDSHAAMFGHGRYAAGTVKATYGTGSSLMALTPDLAADTPMLARTIAWSIDGRTQFALEGNIAMTGSAVQWVGEFLHLADPAKTAASLAATVTDADGVYFVPAMVGLGAPHWDAQRAGRLPAWAAHILRRTWRARPWMRSRTRWQTYCLPWKMRWPRSADLARRWRSNAQHRTDAIPGGHSG